MSLSDPLGSRGIWIPLGSELSICYNGPFTKTDVDKTYETSFNAIDLITNKSSFFIDKDFTRLLLNVGIKSNFGEVEVVSGEYGFELYLITTDNVPSSEFKMPELNIG
jgi:hypothetical protein